MTFHAFSIFINESCRLLIFKGLRVSFISCTIVHSPNNWPTKGLFRGLFPTRREIGEETSTCQKCKIWNVVGSSNSETGSGIENNLSTISISKIPPATIQRLQGRKIGSSRIHILVQNQHLLAEPQISISRSLYFSNHKQQAKSLNIRLSCWYFHTAEP